MTQGDPRNIIRLRRRIDPTTKSINENEDQQRDNDYESNINEHDYKLKTINDLTIFYNQNATKGQYDYLSNTDLRRHGSLTKEATALPGLD